MSTGETPKTVALFVTCLVDFMRPGVGFASVKLLEQAGCTVVVPTAQTCCGQPAFNSGDTRSARAVAEQVIATFERFEAVVVPSGSCGGMIIKHYPELFEGDPKWYERATVLSAKCHELVSFLTDVMAFEVSDTRFPAHVTYHDSCSGLRELGIQEQPRKLMASVKDMTFTELRNADVCCGFGGTFCVKYPDISNKMVGNKIDSIVGSGADTLVAGDLGCLMNMAGKLRREGHEIDVRHVAEILVGDHESPGIGQSDNAAPGACRGHV